MNKLEKKITGTSFKGYLHTTYDQLVSVFGEPEFLVSPDKKTDVQWIINTPYSVAIIYNYKNGKAYLGESGIQLDQIGRWHVGAKSSEAYEWVKTKLHLIVPVGHAIVSH